MKIEFGTRPVVSLNRKGLLLTIIALVLVGLLWSQVGFTRPEEPAAHLALSATIILASGLLLALAETENWPTLARPLFLLGLAAILATLVWTAPVVWADLVALWPRLVLVYAVTVGGYVLHARLWPEAQSSIPATLGISALPVLLVAGCYFLLGTATGRSMEAVCLAIGAGLAVTYFNLGAAALGGGPPLDGGIVLRDGYRLLGNGKTVRGTMAGLIFATLAFALFTGTPSLGFFIGLVALAGDAGASFIKRRLGQPAGQPIPLLDQWDSILFLLLAIAFWPGLAYLKGIVPILIMGTLFVQVFGNRMLHGLGKKAVPW